MRGKIFALFLAIISISIPAAPLTWTNTAGGSWHSSANWFPNQVPGAGDSATITAAGSYTITLAADVTVSSLQLGGGASAPGIQIDSHTLEATDSATISPNGTLTLQGGGLRGALTVHAGGTLVFSGTPQKNVHSLRLVNRGTVRLLGGSLLAGSTPTTLVTNIGLWEIDGDASFFPGLEGPTPIFVNQGTIRKIGGSGTSGFSNIQFINSGLVEAQSGTIQFSGMFEALLGGTFTAAPNTTVQLNGGTYTENGAVFNGGGTSIMTAGTLTLVNNSPAGLLLSGGTVKLTSTFQDNGAITNLTLNGAALSGTNAVLGTLTLNGSTLSGTNEVSGTLTVLSGSLRDLLTVRPGGTVSFSGAAPKTLSALRLINNGTVRWLGGELSAGFNFTETAVITNSGLFEINCDEMLSQWVNGQTLVFVNKGTVRKIGGAGLTRFYGIQFDNESVVESQNGTIWFSSMIGMMIGGTFTASPGAAIEFMGGNFTENRGVFSGGGTLRMAWGTLNLVNDTLNGLSLEGGLVKILSTFQDAGAITDLTLNGAFLIGTNEVSGTLNVLAGGFENSLTVRAGGFLLFSSARQKNLYNLGLINNGTVRWLGGALSGGTDPRSTLIINNGMWEISSDASIFHGSTGPIPVFRNFGIIRKTGGSGMTTFSGFEVINSGLIESQSGTIRLPNPYTHNNGTLRLSGGRIDSNGTINFASGTLEGSGSLGATSFTGGTISPGLTGPGKINFTSGLYLGSGTTVNIDAIDATPGTGHDQLAVTGPVALGSANLQITSIGSLPVGSQLRIIDNDGVDGVAGMFNAFPEGGLFTQDSQFFRLRYRVGTGNDVALLRDDGQVHLTAMAFQPDGSYLLNGLGTNFGNYTISATTNFQTWTVLGTTIANSGGNFQFYDTNAVNFPYRFYRSLGPGVSFP